MPLLHSLDGLCYNELLCLAKKHESKLLCLRDSSSSTMVKDPKFQKKLDEVLAMDIKTERDALKEVIQRLERFNSSSSSDVLLELEKDMRDSIKRTGELSKSLKDRYKEYLRKLSCDEKKKILNEILDHCTSFRDNPDKYGRQDVEIRVLTEEYRMIAHNLGYMKHNILV